MRRLYFLVPAVDVAHKIVDELLLARIEERHIHIIAKEGTPMGDLPEATLAQKSDVLPALQRGVALGGTMGVIAGVAVVTIPAFGVALSGGVILAMGLAGAGTGALMATMIGVSVPNTRLTQFEDAINKGEILMLVDVPKARVDEIDELVKKHHPEAKIEGTEPTIPAFP